MILLCGSTTGIDIDGSFYCVCLLPRVEDFKVECSRVIMCWPSSQPGSIDILDSSPLHGRYNVTMTSVKSTEGKTLTTSYLNFITY